MINFQQDGEIINFANSGSAISSGDPVIIGNRVGIAMVDIAATSGTGAVKMTGVFSSMGKDGDEAFSQGDALFYDSSDSTFTKTATGNKWAGMAFEAASSDATSCTVFLCPMPKQAAIVAYSAGTNLSALAVTATNVAASNFTANNAAEPTKAEIDAGIDTVVLAIETALDLKADNADVETLRTEIETRLDAIDTGIAALITSLKQSGLMANS
jgi:predicted RecA/RadA family phage recombinase